MGAAQSTNRPTGVWIADDHPLFRQGVAGLIESGDGLQLLGQSDSGSKTLEALARHRIDLLLLDLNLPGLTGWQILDQVQQEDRPHVLILTTYTHGLVLQQARRLGAAGVVAKDDAITEIIDAIRVILTDEEFYSSAHFLTCGDEDLKPLSARELDLLTRIAEGATNKELASETGISVKTVETHRLRIMRKIQARNAADLTRIAMSAGLI